MPDDDDNGDDNVEKKDVQEEEGKDSDSSSGTGTDSSSSEEEGQDSDSSSGTGTDSSSSDVDSDSDDNPDNEEDTVDMENKGKKDNEDNKNEGNFDDQAPCPGDDAIYPSWLLGLFIPKLNNLPNSGKNSGKVTFLRPANVNKSFKYDLKFRRRVKMVKDNQISGVQHCVAVHSIAFLQTDDYLPNRSELIEVLPITSSCTNPGESMYVRLWNEGNETIANITEHVCNACGYGLEDSDNKSFRIMLKALNFLFDTIKNELGPSELRHEECNEIFLKMAKKIYDYLSLVQNSGKPGSFEFDQEIFEELTTQLRKGPKIGWMWLCSVMSFFGVSFLFFDENLMSLVNDILLCGNFSVNPDLVAVLSCCTELRGYNYQLDRLYKYHLGLLFCSQVKDFMERFKQLKRQNEAAILPTKLNGLHEYVKQCSTPLLYMLFCSNVLKSNFLSC